jgi:hypothetical protein
MWVAHDTERRDGAKGPCSTYQEQRDGYYCNKVVLVALKFAISPGKTLEAMAFVAKHNPGLSPKYVSKIFFYAEKWHLNRYGRPIVADTYIAMSQGPVPSTIKNFIDENWERCEKPEGFDATLSVKSIWGLRRLNARRESWLRLSEQLRAGDKWIPAGVSWSG